MSTSFASKVPLIPKNILRNSLKVSDKELARFNQETMREFFSIILAKIFSRRYNPSKRDPFAA